MKDIIYLTIMILVAQYAAKAQFSLGDIYNKTKDAVQSNSNTGTLSNEDIIEGLKEALTVGTRNSTEIASKIDGYYKNPEIKIPFPPEARDMEQKLRVIGMGTQVDKFVETLNRAAEEAAKDAAPIFVNAIKQMTITDGMNILKGNDDAATRYLKEKTTNDLYIKFKLVVQDALKKVQITRYWDPLATSYNRIPFVKKVNPDLEDYTTHKAIDGLFVLIAKEEARIRKDPAARVTDILKKVFSAG